MIFEYEAGMPIHLGVGWDPQSPDSNKLIRGYLAPATPSTESPSAQDDFSQSFIETFSELERETRFSIDASGTGKIGVFKVSGRASYERQRKAFRSSRNIIWRISGRRTYETVSAFGLNLTDTGRLALEDIKKSGDHEKLRQSIGSHVVTSLSKTSEVHIVYIFTTSSATSNDSVKSAISAHISGVTGSGSANASFFESVKKADQGVQLEIQLFHSGIDDNTTSVSELVAAAPGDLTRVRELMTKAIRGISWKKARISSFSAEPTSSVFEVPKVPYDADLLRSRVARYQTLQGRIIDRILELDDLTRRDATHEITLLEGAEEAINLELDRLNEAFDGIDQTVKAIRAAPSSFTGFPHIVVPSGKLHWIALDFGKFLTWKYEVSGNTYDSHSERIVGQATFWPVFSIKNPDLVRRFEMTRNGTIHASLSQAEVLSLLEGGRLELRKHFQTTHRINSYCWRGRWGEDCNPWAADTERIARELAAREGPFSYTYRITDIENNVHEFPFKSASHQSI